MAEGTSSGEIHDDALCIVTQSKKTASVWNYFHFRKRDRCNKAALYKLCEKAVVNVGGTTNLKNYLCMWHRKEYDEPYSQTAVRAQQPLTNFLKTATPTRMAKFPACSKHAKTLMQGVAEFIAKDLHPISVVDGVGFLNLMHLAEPRYIVPCRATMTARINEMYTAVKEQVAGVVAQQHLQVTCGPPMPAKDTFLLPVIVLHLSLRCSTRTCRLNTYLVCMTMSTSQRHCKQVLGNGELTWSIR